MKEKKNNRGEPQHHLVAVYICLGKKKHVLTDPFCGSLLEGIDRELRKYHRAMVCGTVDDNESFAKVLQNSNLEGAILLGCEAEFCTALVRQIPIPIVFVDSYGEGFDNIGLEDYEGGYEMTSYLIGQGHRKGIRRRFLSRIFWQMKLSASFIRKGSPFRKTCRSPVSMIIFMQDFPGRCLRPCGKSRKKREKKQLGF